MAKLRGGLLGYGMISEFHLRGWQRIPEVEIVALGNRTIAKAEARRAQFFPEARTYDNLEAMLEKERLDFIDILTIPSLHREHCQFAMQAGAHVICQKPLCDSLEDARALVVVAKGYPKLFAVHENHRYRPWFQRMLALHRDGFFGTSRLFRLEQHDATEPPEAYKLETNRGVLVDMIVALLREPARVYARVQHLNPKVKGESQALVVYEYPETTAVVDIAWKTGGVSHGSLVLEGEKGAAYYEGSMVRGASSRFRLTQGNRVVADESRSPYDDYMESFYLFERECVDCMLTGKPVTQSGEENLRALASTFAAYAAAERGQVVDLADFLR